jgi:hypothetical protein
LCRSASRDGLGQKRKLSDYQRAEAIKRRAAAETLKAIAQLTGSAYR